MGGKCRLLWTWSLQLCILHLYFCLAIFSPNCDARKSAYMIRAAAANSRISDIKQVKTLNRVDIDMALDSNTDPYAYSVSSPFSLPPYDSLPPITLPENGPPFCVYPPPFTPQPPATTIPSPPAPPAGGGGGFTPFVPPPPPMSSAPIGPIENPPPSPVGGPGSVPNPPVIVPNPPSSTFPNPPSPGTPSISFPSPPTTNVPTTPGGFVPRPPLYLPPIIYPTPNVPPPPRVAPSMAVWCVAKPAVPEPIIQEAMNYACGSGADCDQIQPNGACFQPNTLLAHASYAFNSYFQRTKVAGGTCEFGGTAILVTVDPSYDGCHFLYN
ncbi:hypothetical protein M9H77_14896 [Catharanthus roseus]|uniref:Uncharacterized protein n=1 Tax=Catharanthus roseus TaxID=4058 RepID=A0ACC0BPL5_CATRO|nr:hypothetical protein M9H77_14896 [Catharanthus roseus]